MYQPGWWNKKRVMAEIRRSDGRRLPKGVAEEDFKNWSYAQLKGV
jgi:hypothetical protein